jgi:hypothetical protein
MVFGADARIGRTHANKIPDAIKHRGKQGKRLRHARANGKPSIIQTITVGVGI